MKHTRRHGDPKTTRVIAGCERERSRKPYYAKTTKRKLLFRHTRPTSQILVPQVCLFVRGGHTHLLILPMLAVSYSARTWELKLRVMSWMRVAGGGTRKQVFAYEWMRYTLIEFERHARVLYPVSSPTICYMRLWRLHIRVYDHRCTSVRSSYRRRRRCSPRGPKSSSAGLILLAAFHPPRSAGRPSSSIPRQRPSPRYFAAAAPAGAGPRLGRLSPV